MMIASLPMLFLLLDIIEKPKSNKNLSNEDRLVNDVYSYILARKTFINKSEVVLPYKLINRLIMLTDEEEKSFIKKLEKRFSKIGKNYKVKFKHGNKGLHNTIRLYI